MNAQINDNFMAYLIDKDALVAEIDDILDYADVRWSSDYITGARRLAVKLKDAIDTLEVKEVDVDFAKETDMWIKDNEDTNGFFNVQELAKHFFELGLKATNPITSADRGTAEEIIINLKKIESDYNVCLTKEIEWVRKQVGQPELNTKQD